MRTRVGALISLGAAAMGAALWSTGALANTTAGPQGPAAAFDAARAFQHVERMVAIGPRPAGSTALRQTRAYITRQLTSMGLTVQEQPFIVEAPVGRVEMVNLIVRLPGDRPDRILVAGHYDTKLMRDAAFVGANDGGSSRSCIRKPTRLALSA